MAQCECGCGVDAGAYIKTGQPKRFLQGHNAKHRPHEEAVRRGLASGEARRAKRDAAVPDRTCENCGIVFNPRLPGRSRQTMAARRYCSRECAFGDIEDLMIRIFRQVETNHLTGCWIWTGVTQRSGHGVVGRGRRRDGIIRVHRAVYEELRRPVPAGSILHHECQNPACCNPDHLTEKTQSQHMADHWDEWRR